MQEFWAFVEKRGVVFIAFDDEMFPLPQSEAAAKIFRNAADQERWLQPRHLKYPSQHRGRRGLAMRTRHYNGLAGAQKIFLLNLRQRAHGDALIQYMLQLHNAA